MTHPGVGSEDERPDGPWWVGGLSLADRLAAPCPPLGADSPDAVPDHAPDIASGAAPGPASDAAPVSAPGAGPDRRLQEWRQDYSGPHTGLFAARLADAGLDEAGLRALLAEPAAALAERAGEPAWAGYVREALAAAPEEGRPPGPGPTWAAGFAAVLAPFTETAARRLTAAPEWAAVEALADLDALRACFTAQLAAGLVRLARRTLVLELNVMRVTGRLAGASGEARFADFVRQASGRTRLTALVTEYPVLARLLAQTCRHTVDAWAELLGRFAGDRAALVTAVLGSTDPGRLVHLAIGAGDRHQRGRAVALLRFEQGRRLVYKPRPLTVHRHFNDLVHRLNALLPDTGLRTLAVLPRPGYGWAEFAEPAPCTDHDGLDLFYRRLGVLLALLHLLSGTDIHYENLVACGDQPVLVDLETLFHPALGRPEPPGGDPALRLLTSSVHRIALLPFPLIGAHGVLDLSGLGGDRDSVLPMDVAGWDSPGTDEMRLVRGPARFPGAVNRPRLNGVDADPGDHAEALLSGFRAGYHALADAAGELAGPDGLLALFATDTTRVVVRPTRSYAALLDESTHPDVLRDALDRDRLLDLLWRESADDPVRRPLVTAELAELWAGDVPLFAATPSARQTSVDGRPVGLPWAETGLEQALRRLGELGRTDLYDQEWIIRAALATRRGGVRCGTRAVPPGPQPPTVPDPDRLLAAACGIADRILARAHGDHHRVNWLTLEPIAEQRWALMPQGAGLAGGYCGTALFLAQLAALTGTERYAEVARRALGPLPGLLAVLSEQPRHLAAVGAGGFTGLAGIAYALARLAPLLGDPELLDWTATAVHLTAAAPGGAEPDAQQLSGDAGCLAAMLAVHRATGQEEALAIALGCAERLAAGPADSDGTDSAAASSAEDSAHRGWALRRFAAVTGRTEFSRPALRHLEAGLARHLDGGPAAPDLGWCGGLAGAALAVADSGVPAERPAFARFLAGTVELLGTHGPLADHSLLHGEAGVLELLLATSPNGTVAGLAATRAGMLLSALDRFGPRCGTPEGVPTPGLLTGLAGIGYTLLRLGLPSRTPSVLLLEPPLT
ncbi:type 2 lanthipeptide synthetase LanM family protein [Kitasatospora sp. NPDC056138]|uniref:type 2 lanthipeptide synthetase LanM family protein n=1 Tax=Kitasatospora sp. NPDC056138 TaxID=3345724 RepID=UPI0035D67FB0